MRIVLVLHDLTRWLILITALWTILSAISGRIKKSDYKKSTNLSSLLFTVFMDFQIIFGFLLYFNNGWFDKLKHLSVYMRDSNQRFFTLEHWAIMLTAWILVHAGRTVVAKANSPEIKYKKTIIYFGIALLLILAAIPWPFREALARPWYRWF